MDWLATIRGRLGYAFGNWLLYATGGLAVADVEAYDTLGFVNETISASTSEIRWGWTVGGGLEFAFGRNWTLKGEYLYVDLGEVRFNSQGINFDSPMPPPCMSAM